MTTEQTKLNEYQQQMPGWLKYACHNSPVVNRKIHECASQNLNYSQMFECVFHALLTHCFVLENEAIKQAMLNPPNDLVQTRRRKCATYTPAP